MESIIIIIIIVVLLVIAGIYAFMSFNKIKKNGIETEAEVSRIEVERTQSINHDIDMIETETTKHYYVKYKNENGEEIESLLSNPKMGLQEGDIIKIKYLPEKTKNVIRVK